MDTAYYERLLVDFKKSKEALETLTKRQNEMKAELIKVIQDNGYEDDKGHLWLSLGDSDIKYERRVSRSFDASAAEMWARENGLWDEMKKVIEVLDEDKMLGYAWNNKEAEPIIQAFYTEKESWAFKA